MDVLIIVLGNESNLLFMRNRDLFNEEYFSFIRQLISSNKVIYAQGSQ